MLDPMLGADQVLELVGVGFEVVELPRPAIAVLDVDVAVAADRGVVAAFEQEVAVLVELRVGGQREQREAVERERLIDRRRRRAASAPGRR